MQSLLFYILIFLLSAILFKIGTDRKSKFLTILALIIPVLVGGLRYEVGQDYDTYTKMYYEMSSLSFVNFMTGYFVEPTFYFLIQVSKILVNGPVLYYLISSFLTVLFFYLGLKRFKFKNPALVYVLYLFVFFPLSFNLMRQGVSRSIVFLAMSFIEEKKFLKYFGLIILATLFHYSAFILLPLYLINKIFNNKKESSWRDLRVSLFILIAGLSVVALFVYIVSYVPLPEKYLEYLSVGFTGLNITFFIKFFIAMMAIFVYLDNHKKFSSFKYFYLLAILEIVFLAVGFFNDVGRRFSYYLTIPSLVVIVRIAQSAVVKFKLSKITLNLIIFIFAVLYFILYFYIIGNSNIFPYNSILSL